MLLQQNIFRKWLCSDFYIENFHYYHIQDILVIQLIVLDFMTEKDNKIQINDQFADEMLQVWRKYNEAKDTNSLLLIPFTTVNQYLYTLKEILENLHIMKSKALFYLAAAVSDFFIPQSRMPST